jgi:hypothetical protein
LRGTKQSRTMKHKRAYNDKGCKSIRAGILDCFAMLAMTNTVLLPHFSWLACLLLVACCLLPTYYHLKLVQIYV